MVALINANGNGSINKCDNYHPQQNCYNYLDA